MRLADDGATSRTAGAPDEAAGRDPELVELERELRSRLAV